MIVMKDNQMELTLGNQTLRSLRAELHSQRRDSIARLWFHRMHCVVDRTRAWSSNSSSHAEQAYLTLVPTPSPDQPSPRRF